MPNSPRRVLSWVNIEEDKWQQVLGYDGRENEACLRCDSTASKPHKSDCLGQRDGALAVTQNRTHNERCFLLLLMTYGAIRAL